MSRPVQMESRQFSTQHYTSKRKKHRQIFLAINMETGFPVCLGREVKGIEEWLFPVTTAFRKRGLLSSDHQGKKHLTAKWPKHSSKQLCMDVDGERTPHIQRERKSIVGGLNGGKNERNG